MTKKPVLILLSDTDIVFAKVCEKMFEREEGWDPIITTSFDEALKHIKSTKPKLILTDIILKDGDGFELLKSVRSSKDKTIAETPVVILTALSHENDRALAKELAATKYLVKSDVSVKDVIKELKAVLS